MWYIQYSGWRPATSASTIPPSTTPMGIASVPRSATTTPAPLVPGGGAGVPSPAAVAYGTSFSYHDPLPSLPPSPFH
jgi:hypothetical protein